MIRVKRTSKHDPCFCGDTTGNCRQTEDGTRFCHTFADARLGEKILDHVCVKEAAGHTATFRPDNASEWSQQQRQEWNDRKRARAERKREQEKKLSEAEMLSLQERDHLYREILNELSLDAEGRAELKRRGFSDLEIDLCGIKCVSQYQQLQKKYPLLLPGISSNGQTLLVGKGFLLPVRNTDGLIVSCQVRLTEIRSDRYRWLTGKTKSRPDGPPPHVYYKNGFGFELPLSIFRPSEKQPTGLGLIEGTHLKPFLACERLGLSIIGAAGGLWLSSPHTFKTSLDQLSAELGGIKEIIIFPDSGDIANKPVVHRWKKTVDLLHQWGWSVKVAWWGQFTKDYDDIDELSDYSVITYISPEEFCAIAENREKTSANESKEQDEKCGSDWAWEQWVGSRKFTPDITINSPEFYFPDNLPLKDAIIAIKSGLGTGKTKAIIELIKLHDYVRAMIIGYRNNLLFQTASRALKEGLKLYHLREDDGISLLADAYTNLLFCLDSIGAVDGYFKGVDVYVDEIVSVLLHGTGGGTLGDSQAKALRILTHALQVCNRVVILDGNLADIHAHFVASLAPNKKLIKIENIHKIKAHTIKIIDGIDEDKEIKKSNRSHLVQMMIAPDIKPWIFCDSKEKSKIYGKILTDCGKNGFVLNSETTGEEWAQEFLLDADAFILKYKPDFMIVSPTAESGVSVTVKGHFTHKFSFFVGVQGTNSQHQSMFRLRDNSIPHFVFCPEKSNLRDRANPMTYSTKQFQQIISDRILQSGILATVSSDNSESALEIIGKAIARQSDKWFEFSCLLGTLDNYEMMNLRKCLLHALQDAGHDVEILQWSIDQGLTKLEKETNKEVKRQHAKEMFIATHYKSIEEALQKKKKSPNKDVQRRIEKTFLLDKVPGIDSTDIWGEDFIYECHLNNKFLIPGLQRFWMLNNFDVSQKKHEAAWFFSSTQEDFFGMRQKKMDHDIVWGLRELNILRFFEIDSYNKDSPEVIETIALLRNRKDVQNALKINIKPETENGDERIEIIGQLLGLIGHKNYDVGKKTFDGIRLNSYLARPSWERSSKKKAKNDDRSEFDFATAHKEILQAFDRKFHAWMESDKAKISWQLENKNEPEEIVNNRQNSDLENLELLIQWDDIQLLQERLDKTWQMLTLEQHQIELNKEMLKKQLNTEIVTTENNFDIDLRVAQLSDPDIDVYAMEYLTENWSKSFKEQVWRSLPDDVKQRLKQLRNDVTIVT